MYGHCGATAEHCYIGCKNGPCTGVFCPARVGSEDLVYCCEGVPCFDNSICCSNGYCSDFETSCGYGCLSGPCWNITRCDHENCLECSRKGGTYCQYNSGCKCSLNGGCVGTPNSYINSTDSCNKLVVVSENRIIATAVGVTLGILVFIILVPVILIKGYYRFNWVFLLKTPLIRVLNYPHKQDIASLPEPLRWSFIYAIKNTYRWNTGNHQVYFIAPESREYDNLKLMIFASLGIRERHILRVEGVFNGILLQSFVSEREKLIKRLSGTIFGKKSWLQKKEINRLKELRSWTYDQYEKLVVQYPWNIGKIPIIPLIHATNYQTARSIVQTGFASLCKLDEGFYGKGIYLTNKSKYGLSYILGVPKPSIIIAYVLSGNAYPVIENPKAEDSLLGQPIMPSYDSHVVCVNSSGAPVIAPTDEYFIELGRFCSSVNGTFTLDI